MENEDTFPKKHFSSIREVAEWFGENQSTLRFWEKEFGFPKPHTNKKGTRSYTKEDIKDIGLIHYLLRGQKLTIQGAKEKLKSHKKDEVKRNAEIVQKLKDIKNVLVGLKKELRKN